MLAASFNVKSGSMLLRLSATPPGGDVSSIRDSSGGRSGDPTSLSGSSLLPLEIACDLLLVLLGDVVGQDAAHLGVGLAEDFRCLPRVLLGLLLRPVENEVDVGLVGELLVLRDALEVVGDLRSGALTHCLGHIYV